MSRGKKYRVGEKNLKKIILKHHFIRFDKSITDGPMDQPTNGWTDMASYRDARTNPKMKERNCTLIFMFDASLDTQMHAGGSARKSL